MNGSNNSKASIPPYVAYYGMLRDPFGQQIEDDLFYTETSREQRLGTLLHLTQFGNELMIVTGSKGSGKTTLLQQFKARAPESWKIARIDAQEGVDERKLLQQIYRQMNLEFRGATHAELLEQMKMHFEQLQRNSQYCVLLIDNADQLPITAINKVLEMASLTSSFNKPLLRIILFGTETITKTFDDPLLVKYANLPRRTLELSPFSEEQTTHYILNRLSAAHFADNDLFTPSVLLKLYTDSYGWPARINELARNMLTNSLPKGERESSPGFDLKTFRSSRLLGLLFATGIVAAVFIFQDNIFQWTNQLTEKNNTSAVQSLQDVPKPAPQPVPQPAPAAKTPTSLVEKLKQRDPAYRSPASTIKNVKSKPSKPATIATAKQELIPVEAPSPVVDIATVPRKESWILDQNSKHYTLQIVAGENLKTIEEFIAEHNLKNNIAFYRSVRKGKPWYGLIYGVYPHKQAATSAIDQMSVKLQRLKPWVRSIGGIKTDINKTRPKST